jgi:outer membrane lipoprotein-sorting protein
MKRYIYVIVLILLAAQALKAQENTPLARFYDNLLSSCVEFDMSYSIRMSGVKLDGKGVLELQGDSWILVGNGMEIRCDGKTLWTVDPESKEVVIGSLSDDITAGIITNPAVMLINLRELFSLREVLPTKEGKSLIYTLYPKAESEVSFVNMEILKGDSSLKQLTFSLEDGTSAVVNISSMKSGKKKLAEYFSRSVNYDSSWIVTDLR